MSNLNELLTTALIALASWFVKDFIIGLISRRNDLTRREWEYRLKEIFCPLYFWSGICAFDNDCSKGVPHGIAELESLLAKSAYLIPTPHYHTMIKLIERAYNQDTTLPTAQYVSMREYLYSQIVLLNYVLFKRSEYGDIKASTSFRHQYRYLLRIILASLSHVLIWLCICALLGTLYWSFVREIIWPLALFGVVIVALFVIDLRKREGIRAHLNKID